MDKTRLIVSLLSLLCMAACTPRSVREAQDVVAQADSSWQAGQPYADSALLAQSYRTLEHWQWVYPDDYVHACYHYGRLLREKENPVAAMECFIQATHSRTHDYHILGRVYSNIGDLCHLAGEFPLSYDMFKQSANMFLRNGDTINYYYALNDMAFELAEQGMEEETLAITNTLDSSCCNSDLHSLIHLTMAYLFAQIEQYDSALYHLNISSQRTYKSSVLETLKARVFWHIGATDSALVYAKRVLASPSSQEQDKYNLLYIIINGDSALSNEEIIDISAQRSDIETDILIPLHNQWALAIHVLELDLHRKRDWRWAIAILGTLIVIGCVISLYMARKRKQHALLSQKIEHMEDSFKDLQSNKAGQVEQTCAILRASTTLQSDLSWKDFEKMCQFANEHFYLLANKLKKKGVLNETEMRLCVLVLIGLSRSDIANTLPYALNSVGKLKDHTAKLLGTTGKNLHDFLLQMAIDA